MDPRELCDVFKQCDENDDGMIGQKDILLACSRSPTNAAFFGLEAALATPGAAASARKLRVTVLRAKGLQHLNWTGDNPYVICQVKHSDPHAKATSFQTKQQNGLDPVWNESHELDPWNAGETLEFTVYDQGSLTAKTEGKASLLSEQFYLLGFEGEIEIQDAKGASLFLRVDSPVASELFQRVGLGGDTQWSYKQFYAAFGGDSVLGPAAGQPQAHPAGSAPAPLGKPHGRSTGSSNAEVSLGGNGAVRTAVAERELRDIFKQCDKNNDGQIGHNELILACRRSPKIASFFGLEAARGRKLHVTVLHAKGLNILNHTGDNPYVVCQVKHSDPHARATSFQTTQQKGLEPVWNESFDLDPWYAGEALEFTVYDQGWLTGRTEGTFSLLSEQFYPSGFEGEVELQDCPGALLVLHVDRLAGEFFQRVDIDDNKKWSWDEFHAAAFSSVGAFLVPHAAGQLSPTDPSGTLSVPSAPQGSPAGGTDAERPDDVAKPLDSDGLVKSIELAEMVRPASGPPRSPGKIWNFVLEHGAHLPGDWDANVEGALDAARQGDIALCAYLAARCFYEHGGGKDGAAALAAPDERCLKRLFLDVAAPVVVEVPPGQEHVWVRLEGSDEILKKPIDQIGVVNWVEGRVWVRNCGHAELANGPNLKGPCEHFNVGEMVELSHLQWRQTKFRQLVLTDEQVLEYRKCLHCDDTRGWRDARRATEAGGGVDANKASRLSRQRPTAHGHTCGKCGAARQPSAQSCPHCGAKAGAPLAYRSVPGTWFHVLAYPLAGDVTKVLLRPAAEFWTKRQRSLCQGATRYLGETLISQCAKSCHWEMVETLMQNGVPCPDLAREFQDVCGRDALVQRRWLQDSDSAAKYNSQANETWESASASSEGHRSQSLFELAAEAQDGLAILRRLLKAMQAAGKSPVDLRGGTTPLIVAMARAQRWNIVRFLLEEAQEYGAQVSAEPLREVRRRVAHPPQALTAQPWSAPPDVLELVEASDAPTQRAKSVGDYFLRMHRGEVLGRAEAPAKFTLEEGCLVREDGVERVLACSLRLGCSVSDPTGKIVFVSVSAEELDAARSAVKETTYAMLPMDLTNHPVTCDHLPCTLDASYGHGQFCWLALLCAASYVQGCDKKTGAGSIQVPRNHFPTPYITRNAVVKILAKTPCCQAPLKGVNVHIARRHVGNTEADGSLKIELPLGKHLVTAPDHSQSEVWVEVKAGDMQVTQVELIAGDTLYMYLTENPHPDCAEKDAIMLCSNRTHECFPEDMRPYVGSAEVPDSGWKALSGFASDHRCPTPVLSLANGTRRCSEVFHCIEARPDDGRSFVADFNAEASKGFAEGESEVLGGSRISEDAATWFSTMEHECQVATLFQQQTAALRIGDLVGTATGKHAKAKLIVPEGPAAAARPIALGPVAVASRGRGGTRVGGYGGVGPSRHPSRAGRSRRG